MRGAWYLIPISILWLAFALFWEAEVLSSDAPPFFVLWGLPFVGIGLYLVFGRILVARKEAAETVYAITDRRVIVIGGAFQRRLTEISLRMLPPVQLEIGQDGFGTITFGATSGWFNPPLGWPTFGMWPRPLAFAEIADAAVVHGILDEARETAARA